MIRYFKLLLLGCATLVAIHFGGCMPEQNGEKRDAVKAAEPISDLENDDAVTEYPAWSPQDSAEIAALKEHETVIWAEMNKMLQLIEKREAELQASTEQLDAREMQLDAREKELDINEASFRGAQRLTWGLAGLGGLSLLIGIVLIARSRKSGSTDGGLAEPASKTEPPEPSGKDATASSRTKKSSTAGGGKPEKTASKGNGKPRTDTQEV